eukprot:1160744-Pelagomonas_calceolata.AAC.5
MRSVERSKGSVQHAIRQANCSGTFLVKVHVACACCPNAQNMGWAIRVLQHVERAWAGSSTPSARRTHCSSGFVVGVHMACCPHALWLGSDTPLTLLHWHTCTATPLLAQRHRNLHSNITTCTATSSTKADVLSLWRGFLARSACTHARTHAYTNTQAHAHTRTHTHTQFQLFLPPAHPGACL